MLTRAAAARVRKAASRSLAPGQALEEDWRLVASPLELEPFVGGAERLYVLERRAAATRLVRALGRAIRSPFRRATAN